MKKVGGGAIAPPYHPVATPLADGHYVSHPTDESMVRTYDDQTVKGRRVNNFLELAAIQKSAHLLFHFMEPAVQATERKRNARILSIAEQRIADKYWLGLLVPQTSQLTLLDAYTALGAAQHKAHYLPKLLPD